MDYSTLEIPRNHLAEQLIDTALRADGHVLLAGPAHWGKSWLLKKLVKQTADILDLSVLYLDFYAIRHCSPDVQDREALRQLLGFDDEALIDYERACQEKMGQNRRSSLLHAYLEENLDANGVLLMDHLEKLPDHPAITRWFSCLYEFLSERKVKVIWAERALGTRESKLSPWRDQITCFDMPVLSKIEICNWLDSTALIASDQTEIVCEKILASTGGFVGLTRDYSAWLQGVTDRGINSIASFGEAHTRKYSPSCQAIYNAICLMPTERDTWASSPSPALSDSLVMSGAYITKKNKLVMPSQIHLARINSLVTTENLLNISSEFLPLLRSKALLEVKIRNLFFHLSTRSDFSLCLRDLLRFIQKQGMEPKFYIRDPHHSLIWKKITPRGSSRGIEVNEEFMLDKYSLEDKPYLELLRGEKRYPKIPDVGESCYFPVRGISGQIDLIVKIESLPKKDSQTLWSRMVLARTIGCALSEVEPALGKHISEYQMRFHAKEMAKIRSRVDRTRINLDDSEFAEIVKETTAQAVAVLVPELNPISTPSTLWTIGFFQTLKTHGPMRIYDTDLLDQPNREKLSDYSSDIRVRGCVVSGEDAEKLFPKLTVTGFVTTLYIKPIRVQEENSHYSSRLVVFVFYDKYKKVLASQRQFHLGFLAQRLVYMDFLHYRWGKEHEEELNLINIIGNAMSEALSNPADSFKNILTAIKRHFDVSAVSINQVITANKKGETVDEIHILCSSGYKKSYSDIIYPIGEDKFEGKTGYVARTKETIVSWDDFCGTGEKNIYKYNPDTDKLLPFFAAIKGEDQCGPYINEKEVRCYLGTPIIWRDLDSGKDDCIGVLVMANRTQTRSQRFSSRKVSAARRIAYILAPILYLIKHRSKYGVGGRIRTLSAILRGLDHELMGPLAKLHGKAKLISLIIESLDKRFEQIEDVKVKNEEVIRYSEILEHKINALKGLGLNNIGSPELIHLKGYMKRECGDLLDKLSSSNIEFVDEIDGDAKVYVDAAHLDLALTNIIDNAREFICEQRLRIRRIRVFCEKIDSRNVIVISNLGPPISKKIHSTLFEPFVSFHQEETTDVRGLGLALVQEVVELAGGSVDHKRIGEETCFRIFLQSSRI